MDINFLLVAFSSFFVIAGYAPYIIDTIKGKTKPRVVTWFIWGLLTVISFAAAIVERNYATAVFVSISAIGSLSVVVLGWKHGDKKIEFMDKVCLVGALVGLILWWLFNSPSIAVAAMIIIDMIGAIPTIIHSWKKPGEETVMQFSISLIASIITLYVVKDNLLQITASGYPIYLTAMNILIISIIEGRKKFLSKKR